MDPGRGLFTGSGQDSEGHRDQFDPTQLNVGDDMPDEGKVLFPELMLKGFAVECLL